MDGDKSLLYASTMNDLSLIKLRLENAKPAQLKKSSQEAGTPLHAAALHDNKEAVDLLLAAGADNFRFHVPASIGHTASGDGVKSNKKTSRIIPLLKKSINHDAIVCLFST